MAVKLRLRRMGRKKKPFYRIIAADSRSPRDGKFIEEIGYYNPISDPMTIEVKEDRALYWMGVGAIPSDTVKSLFRKKGITLKFTLAKQGLSPEKIEEELKKWEVLQLEREKRFAAKNLAKQSQKAAKKDAEQEPAEVVEESAETEVPANEN